MIAGQTAAFETQVEQLINSGWLGRSHTLARLFDFLADARRSNRPVREADIAHGVLGQRVDLSGDASVRVHVHRLRKKLASFYEGPGAGAVQRLAIPMGDYKLDLVAADLPTVKSQPSLPPWRMIAIVGLIALMTSNLIGWAWFGRASDPARALQHAVKAPVWSMIDGARPTILVIGDYYIFGELDGFEFKRMIREFDVNSKEDLQEKLMLYPSLQGRYVDVDANYAPTGATEALQHILPVARAAVGDPKRLRVMMSSDLTAEMLKTNDIVYVGYLSALRVLEEPAFANAGLKVGESYDDLIDRKSGRVFASNAGLAARGQTNVDYGYLHAFDGPSGNHIIIIAGTRDIGVRQMAETAVSPAFASAFKGSGKDIEALYEVRGIGRTNISARQIGIGERAKGI